MTLTPRETRDKGEKAGRTIVPGARGVTRSLKLDDGASGRAKPLDTSSKTRMPAGHKVASSEKMASSKKK